MYFVEIIKQQLFFKKKKKTEKHKAMYGVFFPNWSFIISEKCMVTPNFIFGYQEHLLSSAFSAQFETAQKYPCSRHHP